MPTRNILAAAVFAVAASVCAAGAAFAQPAPSPAPTAKPAPSAAPAAASPAPATSGSPAPSPTPTPYKLITISGSADGGFTSIEGADSARFVTGTPSRVFDASTGPFFDANGGRQLAPANDFSHALDLQNANIQVNFNGPFIGGKIEESFGTDADVIASNGQSRSGNNLTQAYLQAARGPVTLLAGKFSSLAGAEVIEAPGNSNYSRSYLFGYAVPFTHTGVRLTYVVNPKASIVVGANNGWDDWKFAGKKKTFEGALLLTPSPAFALTLDTYNGNDFAVGGNSTLGFLPIYTNRTLYDGVLTVHATSALTLIANYDNGSQLGDGTGAFDTARWNGIAGYLNYAFTPVYGISLRKETFHDPEGFRTSLAQRVQSNTATFNYSPGTNFIFRLEYRLDTSDLNAFSYRGFDATTGIGRPHQSSLGVETIVKFP
ncbi:MAG: outer membrane beta-barrel protein [Candidatus Eremiobacteraeota bacterium]|nr:outer membrane beta-barrel protein [Candidatus Eremiobacteraeota bacterium]